MKNVVRYVVSEEHNGMNAGRYLRGICNLSARTLAVLKRTPGGITANGYLLRSVDFVKTGDVVEISLPREENTTVPVKGELDILFEDAYLLIVNKPHSMPVHPVKTHQTDTLSNIIAYRAKESGSDFVFRAVNRLDRDTSGIVMIAKDRHTASMMQNTSVEKHYYAVCYGITDEQNTINAPIALSENSKIVRCVSESGQSAVTHYKRVCEYGTIASLVDLVLETGRTHQIRCHMSYIGHPLFGDDLYGGKIDLIPRQALHCYSVSFSHPHTAEEIFVTAPMPEDILSLINKLKNGDESAS